MDWPRPRPMNGAERIGVPPGLRFPQRTPKNGWGLVSSQPSPSFSCASGVLLDAIFSSRQAGL